MHKPLKYYIGNALMAFSACLVLYIYYPILQVYITPHTLPQNFASYPLAIEIPKLQLFSPIIAGVDPFNEKLYRDALTRGVAMSKTGVMPGEKGTVYIFAHSSDYPWNITRYNTIFYRIGELKNGDKILITQNKKLYTYVVTGQKTVWPQDISYITDTKKDQLILQTCTPIGTALQRLLIFASPL